jgi:aminopeptidase YwaD
MRKWLGATLAAFLAAGTGHAQKPPLLPEKDVAALANELSGETAKRNLEGLARQHRQRGSQGFHAAAELIAERARAYGLSDVVILQFPADGKIFYGTQRSRPAWDAVSAVLSEETVAVEGATVGAVVGIGLRELLVASYEAEPIVLAEDSESAEVTADLVDVGNGTKESDYAGKDVKGKIVLAGAAPGAVQDLAVGKFGAVGIVSYAQNQKTAWWGEDENLIRWGHLETFSPNKTFAFMVSLKTARTMRDRLAKGEKIYLHATVEAGQHPGNYEVVTATIPGADPKLKDEEIAFSCHLDHQRPGANDNASGCVTILEVARTLQKLIADGALARPARTIRFIWPPEIEGTLALLNSDYDSVHPLVLSKSAVTEGKDGWMFIDHSDPRGGTAFFPFHKHIKAVIHMDMVGGGPETKAVFHVTRGPMSLPSFVHDVAWAFAEFANEQSYKFAATGKAEYPLVAPEGGKEPLRAEYSPYSMGSDHDVYQDSSFAIPSIYLNDWPDRYIHTNFDTAANIDPTKLKRAAFIGAASGYFLAGELGGPSEDFLRTTREGELARSSVRVARSASLSKVQREDAEYEYCAYEKTIEAQLDTLSKKGPINEAPDRGRRCWTSYPPFGPYEPITSEVVNFLHKRKTAPSGPLAVFGYDYFADHAKAMGISEPKLLSYEGLWGSGEEYAYEVLNFADGKHSEKGIWAAVSSEYGPVPFELVVEYLRALEKIGLVESK